MKSLMLKTAAVVCLGAMSVSCMTAYDANGNPIAAVDPAVAVAGVAAAGIIGATAARPVYYGRPYYGGYYRGYYGRPYYRGSYYRPYRPYGCY